MATRNPKEEGSEKPGITGGTTTPTGGNGGSGQQQHNIPAFLSSALRIATSYPVGAKTKDTRILGTKGYDTSVSGIMTIDYIPTYGTSFTATSPLNRAMFYDFNALRQGISGNRPYETVDQALYRICVDSMRDLYHYAARIYSTIAGYNALNLYKPKHILKAMGLDADDWIDNAADLYQWLRTHVNALTPFPTVPIGTIADRHKIFNSVYFTDGESSRSQIYIINQVTFWSYEVVDQVKGVTPRSIQGIENGTATFKAFKDLWDEMYTALQGSSDVYIMAADIRRVWQDKVITTLSCPDATSEPMFIKNDSVLLAVMNATCVPYSTHLKDFAKTFRIYDSGENGILKCTPSISENTIDKWEGKALLTGANFEHINTVSDAPSEHEILSAMRLRYVGLVATQTDGTYVTTLQNTSTEVPVGMRMYRVSTVDGELEKIEFASTFMLVDGDPRGMLTMLPALSQFDWHPPVALGRYNMGSGVDVIDGIIEDVQNYIPMSMDQANDIFDAILLAEFGLPG